MRRITLFIACTAFIACADPEFSNVESSTAALLGGAIAQPGEDPGVVALANSFGPFCTGTLVTPRAVLTAAHCIDQIDPANPQIGIFLGADIDDGAQLSVIGGDTRPGWDGVVGPDKPNDVGLLLLKQPQDVSLPIPMNRRTPIEGEDYRHVGFGVFDNSMPADGKKRQGTVTITSVGQGIITSGTDEISICFGDSGGPGFIKDEEVEYIAGIHSFTSTVGGGCRAPAGDARVDVALDWIQPWLDSNDPSCGPDRICATECTDDPDCASCGADGVCVICAEEDPDCPAKATGEPCQQDGECEGGNCVTWDGDITSRFCSEDCGGDEDCADGMTCRTFSDGNLCYWNDNPPGRVGSKCESSEDCFSNLCSDGRCVTTCNLSLGLTCPADFECTSVEDNFYCLGEAGGDGGGGCSTAANDNIPAWLLILVALGALARRKNQLS